MAYWNHRVVKKIDYFGEPYYEIHEVYYNTDHTIRAMTIHPKVPYGDDLEGLKWTLERMLSCLDTPILVDGEVQFINYEDGDPDPDLDWQ